MIPVTYEEFRTTVRELFMKECLQDISKKEREEYLNENEKYIKREYEGKCYSYRNGSTNTFSWGSLRGTTLWNLENLY